MESEKCGVTKNIVFWTGLIFFLILGIAGSIIAGPILTDFVDKNPVNIGTNSPFVQSIWKSLISLVPFGPAIILLLFKITRCRNIGDTK